MSTFAIGDVQGCYKTLRALLSQIGYNPDRDFIWFTGDIINRGPESLRTLQFIKNLIDTGAALTVLGNHDLHLVAVAEGASKLKPEDTLQEILKSKDKINYIEWLRQQPLCYYDANVKYCLVHAGLIPDWSINDAVLHADEVCHVLKSDEHHLSFLKHMYGNEPNKWSEYLNGFERLRFITNVFTRIRFCNINGELNLKNKGVLGSQPKQTFPWFSIPNRKSRNDRVIFGHWAALYPNWDEVKSDTVFPVDSGCCWGNGLTALCLETQNYYYCPNVGV